MLLLVNLQNKKKLRKYVHAVIIQNLTKNLKLSNHESLVIDKSTIVVADPGIDLVCVKD